MAKEIIFQWFVEPLDTESNQGIAFELAKDCEININRLSDKKLKMHNLYQLRTYADVPIIKSAAKQFNWKLKIWRRKGPNAIIEEWIFPKKKKIDLKLKKLT